MNGSERDDLSEMIERYQNDLMRYAQQNTSSNIGSQYTGNMPSCGSKAGPVSTGIDTGTPQKIKQRPDATPPMRMPDASAPIEAAGSFRNHANNRTNFSSPGNFEEESVPEAVPPTPMDEELLRMGGWEPTPQNAAFTDGRAPMTPLYSGENRVTVPSGQRVTAPQNPTPVPNLQSDFRQSPTAPMTGGQGVAFAPNQATAAAPTTGNTRNAVVPLPLASGNVGVRPSAPVEQSPWGPTSAQPPARVESSEIPARTRAPQYADLTATDPNTPTSHPLPRNPQGRRNEVSLQEQNIADRVSEDVSNPGMEQGQATNLSPANPDVFVTPSVLRSGNEEAPMYGAAVSPRLLRDLETASWLMTEEAAARSNPGMENFRTSELMSRLSATGMAPPTPPPNAVGDVPSAFSSGQAAVPIPEDNMEALSAPLPPAEQPTPSVSGQESTVQPNGVYQTESDYPVREQEDWESDQATIIIYAYTARQGLPVPEADVTVSRVFEGRPVLHFLTVTGISGETIPRAVPAPPREWTQAPGYEHPYASYSIQVDAPGYYTVENINVPVFGGEASIQPVEMVPIPENESFIREKLVRESEPAEL